MSQPANYPVPAPKKRLPVWLWVVIAIFGIIFVCVSMIAGVTYYVAHRFSENPQAMIDKIVEANPNIEVVSRDGSGKMTVRDRSSGKLLTINWEDASRGRLRFYDGDKEVTIGTAGIQVREDGKTTNVGLAANLRVPAWVPAYPGSSPKASVEEDGGGKFVFTTPDSPSRIAGYYADSLKSSGYNVTREGDAVTARTASGNREITATPERDGSDTKVSIEYHETRQ
jgi:hypothetical protein